MQPCRQLSLLWESPIEKVVWNLSLKWAKVISDTTLVLEGLQVSFNLLARVLIVGRIGLVFLLGGQGGICAITTLLRLDQYLGLSWNCLINWSSQRSREDSPEDETLSVSVRVGYCSETILPLAFLHVSWARHSLPFVLDYLFKNVYIVTSLGRYSVSLQAKDSFAYVHER